MDDQRGRGAGMTGPGFVFVRGFLWWMLAIFAALGGMAAFMSWYFAMDLSIKARGQLRPAARHGVKASLGGIVREVRVREGQQVAAGETLAVLDDAEWRLQLAQIASDLRANRLRVAEIEASVSEQRRLLQLEEEAAQAAWQRSRLGLEQVRAEQQVGSLALLASYGWKRKPLAELWPVRRAAAAVGARRAEWESARARWQQAGARLRERQTLDLVHAALVADRTYAERRLAQTALVAPVAGVVLTRDVAKRRGRGLAGSGERWVDGGGGGRRAGSAPRRGWAVGAALCRGLSAYGIRDFRRDRPRGGRGQERRRLSVGGGTGGFGAGGLPVGTRAGGGGADRGGARGDRGAGVEADPRGLGQGAQG